jgi:hypothetical protein
MKKERMASKFFSLGKKNSHLEILKAEEMREMM